MEAKRLHILYGPVDVAEAASFIAAALLVSHGVRRDTVAAVELRRGWLVARGWEARHLRPDADTAEGWVRAVVRGKRRLGGSLEPAPPSVPGDYVSIEAAGGWLGMEGRVPRSSRGWAVCYSGPCPRPTARLGLGGVPARLGPAVVNVVLDRVEAGLDVC